MSELLIKGYGDDLSINGTRIGDLTPHEHEEIEKQKGGQNYAPLEDVVISKVKDSSTLIARKPDPGDVSKYVESEVLDGLCCYSAVNQGQLNQTIVDAVIHHLDKEKLPTVPRSIRHKYMSAFLLSATAVTEMDRVIPNVFGLQPNSSIMSDAMDLARGGQFLSVPNNYPEEAWYHYDDWTCDYQCMAIEYLYWCIVSNMGILNDTQTCNGISNEWELCTPELFETTDLIMYDVITNINYLAE